MAVGVRPSCKKKEFRKKENSGRRDKKGEENLRAVEAVLQAKDRIHSPGMSECKAFLVLSFNGTG